jgi:hypothetical protein
MNQMNPLQKHFRQPAIFIKLTSNGKFWKEGSLELTVNGDIPVYPMTAKDEIMLRTPDALLNGTSVVQVIQSCCPNIKNAWEMPSIDVDSTLIAIRIASYGAMMSVTSKCPHCEFEHDYDIDLSTVLSNITVPDYSQSVFTPDGLEIKLRPLNYLQLSKSNNLMFEEQKLVQTMSSPDVSEEERIRNYEQQIKKMVDINNDNLSLCTLSITANGVEVTDLNFISEYYQNTGGATTRLVKDKLQEFADTVGVKPIDTLCTECNTPFKLNVEFDYSSFFDKGF